MSDWLTDGFQEPAQPEVKVDTDNDVWRRWKDNPTPEDFGELYKRNEWAIKSGIKRYTDVGNPIPEAALHAKGLVWFDQALRSFDPSFGVKLTTHVTNKMQQAARYVRANRDIAHIPDDRQVHIWRYRQATEKLTDKLGREPSTQEISDDMKLPYKMVSKLRRELRKDIVQQGYHMDESNKSLRKFEDLMQGFYNDLDPKRQVILEDTFGMFGKPKRKVEETAETLGMTPQKVYYERGKLANLIKERYGDRIQF